MCVYTACIVLLADDGIGICSFFKESMRSLSGWKNASFITEYDDEKRWPRSWDRLSAAWRAACQPRAEKGKDHFARSTARRIIKTSFPLRSSGANRPKHLTDGITDQALCYVHVTAVDHLTERKWSPDGFSFKSLLSKNRSWILALMLFYWYQLKVKCRVKVCVLCYCIWLCFCWGRCVYGLINSFMQSVVLNGWCLKAVTLGRNFIHSLCIYVTVQNLFINLPLLNYHHYHIQTMTKWVKKQQTNTKYNTNTYADAWCN